MLNIIKNNFNMLFLLKFYSFLFFFYSYSFKKGIIETIKGASYQKGIINKKFCKKE